MEFNLVWNPTHDLPWNHKYESRPKLHDMKFNCHFIASSLKSEDWFIIAYYSFLNFTQQIFGSLHKSEFCIMMAQNIGIKGISER